MLKISYSKLRNILFGLFVLSLGFPVFNFHIGFSLKPYMLMVVLVLICGGGTHICRFKTYEKCMFAYVFLYILTIIQLRYIEENIWYSCAFGIILIYYLTVRNLIGKVSIDYIEKVISFSGIVIVSFSLFYYSIGVMKYGLAFGGNEVDICGVNYDRGIPRLIGTQNDPNMAGLYFTLFFFYYLGHLDVLRNKVGLVLTGFAMFLTLSRGVYLGILTTLFVMFLLNPYTYLKRFKRYLVQVIVWLILFVAGIIYLSERSEVDFMKIVEERYESAKTDGGSGRLDIWANAFHNFLDYPIYGVGLNASRVHNLVRYGDGRFIHNTHLEVLSEGGLFTFIPYCLMLFFLIWRGIYLMKYDKKLRFLVATIIAFIIQITFLSCYFDEFFYFILLLFYRYDIEYSLNVNK